MSVLLRPRLWGSDKPTGSVSIEWGHPLTQGLIFADPVVGAGAVTRDLVMPTVTGRPSSPGTSLVVQGAVVTPPGPTNGMLYSYVQGPLYPSHQSYSAAQRVMFTSLTGDMYHGYGTHGAATLGVGSGSGVLLMGANEPGKLVGITFQNAGPSLAAGVRGPAVAPTLGRWYDLVGTYSPTRGPVLYIDGVSYNTPYNVTGTIGPISGLQLAVGYYPNWLSTGGSKVAYTYLWDRALTSDEVAQLRSYPYDFLSSQNPRNRVWIDLASGPVGSFVGWGIPA